MNKLFKNKFEHLNPLIYKYILELFGDNDISFFENEDLHLYDMMSTNIKPIEDLLQNSSSYTLYTNLKIRNSLILYLYEIYKREKSLSIWFPFAGISIEPQLLSYIFNLINEINSNRGSLSNFKLYISDHSDKIVKNGFNSNLFNQTFVKIKESFCKDNGLNKDTLKTTISKAKKSIEIKDDDLIQNNQIIDESFDYVVINSLKLSFIGYEKERIEKLLNRLFEHNNNLRVLIEVTSNYHIQKINLKTKHPLKSKLIISDFVSSQNSDLHIHYFEVTCEVKTDNKENRVDTKGFDIDNLYNLSNGDNLDEIKEVIKSNPKPNFRSNGDKIKYAAILSKVGYHRRAFEVVKEIYNSNPKKDIDLLLKILNEVASKTKNDKLNKSVKLFIKTNRLKDRSFSNEIIGAIKEELDSLNSDK